MLKQRSDNYEIKEPVKLPPYRKNLKLTRVALAAIVVVKNQDRFGGFIDSKQLIAEYNKSPLRTRFNYSELSNTEASGIMSGIDKNEHFLSLKINLKDENGKRLPSKAIRINHVSTLDIAKKPQRTLSGKTLIKVINLEKCKTKRQRREIINEAIDSMLHHDYCFQDIIKQFGRDIISLDMIAARYYLMADKKVNQGKALPLERPSYSPINQVDEVLKSKPKYQTQDWRSWRNL